MQTVNTEISFLRDWDIRNVTSSLGKIITRAIQSFTDNLPSVCPRSNTAQKEASVLDSTTVLILICAG